MYYALPSWYIRTTAIKDRLLAENEATNWYPGHDQARPLRRLAEQQHRLGAVARPVLGHPAAGLAQRRRPHRGWCASARWPSSASWPAQDLSALDPHRPFVDDVTFTRPGEDGTYRRVPQVIDGWFDSGSMPFAQFGAPYRNADEAAAAYPADFICEAIDQTRGWFYTLMAIGTLVFDRSSYRTVLCLGHILAEDGRKMSKHLGNILEPVPADGPHGADAVRWFMLAGGSPWSARRVGHKVLEEIASKVIRTYWSIASFQSLYARANDWSPAEARSPSRPNVLDRWALSEARAADGARSSEALERLRHRAGRQGCSPTTSTTCRTGTSAARAAGSGTATRPRWRTLHECLRRADPADGAVRRRSSPSGSGGAVRRPRRAPDSVHLAAGRRSRTPAWSTPSSSEQVAPGAPAGRTRPRGAGGVGRQDPPAAGPRAGVGARAGRLYRPSCTARSPTS